MPIDLGNSPTGTPPTAEEKTQILSALGIVDPATRSGAENLSNKTLVSPAFSGTASGQLDIPSQSTVNEFSALTRTTLRRELLSSSSVIQRFNIYRPLASRGGLNAANISRSGTTYVDHSDSAQLSTGVASSHDHTTWAEHNFGVCYINFASGGSMGWGSPFSFNLRIANCSANGNSIYHAGVSSSSSGGVPTGRGVGLFLASDGYRLWAQSGVSFSATGDAATDTITATGHNFVNGDIIRFTALTGGAGLVTTSCYFVINVSGNTFQLSNSSGGPVLDFTTNITAATIPTLPTYSSVLSGFPNISNGFQTNQNVLISSDGLGTASLFYSQAGNTIGNTPVATIAVPSSGNTITNMRLSVTGRGPFGTAGTASGFGIMCATFAPFAV
jgi:hypothetical protein